MAGSPQTLQLAHPPSSLPPPPPPHAPASSWPAAWPSAALSLGTQMAGQTSIDARRAMSSFHHHSSSIGSSSPQLLPSSSASSSSSSSSTFPIVYNPPSQSQPLSQSHLSMSAAAAAAAAAASSAAAAGSDSLHHLQDDYHPLDFPFDAHDLPTGHSFSGDLFPASHSSSFWSPTDNKLAPLSPISVKREPAQFYSPERVPQSVSGRFYESSARFDDAPQAYTHLQHHQQQQQQHQPHSNPQHHQSSHQATSTPANADYASADLSPLQAHHVFYAADAHDPAEFPPEHRQHHRRHPSSGSVVPADFFAPTYIEPSELDYASPSAMQLQLHNQYDDQQQQQQQQQHQQQQNQQQQIGQAQVNGVPFPTADTPSPPEYGSSPGLTEDADDSVESDGGEYDDGEYDLLDPAGGVQRRRRRRSTMSTSGYSDASGPLARRRRTSRVAAPVPVPNLTKKSRGRRVPTAPVIVNQGGVQKDLRTYCCVVSGCGKRFARGEHLKRHVRSIHTNEKPHKCPAPGCGKEFSRHDNLGQHMRVHKTFPRNEY